jgi:two-component system, cell cycle sensor histidine kinase DivJ
VSHASSLSARIGALVHESACSDPIARSLHKSLIATKLLSSLVLIAAAPIYLSLRGVPEPWVACCFGWLLLPLASAAFLSRTGRLAPAQAIAATSFIGFAVTLGAGGGALSAAAFAWLVLVPVEAAISLNGRLVAWGSVAAFCAAVGLVALQGPWGAPAPSDIQLQLALLVAPAVAYCALIVSWGLKLYRKRARRERLGAARLHSLSDALGDLVTHHDRTGAVLFASGEAEALFGIAPRDLMGRGFFERVHVGDRPAFLTAVADAADCARTVSVTLRLRVSSSGGHADRTSEQPSFAWVEFRARRFDADTEPGQAKVVAVARDVTALKRHEREIEEARLEAERAAAWKDRFLANISHELRTPLNGIIGFSEMLCSEELAPRDPAKQREYAQIIHSSGQHLLSVVNSILDMSKIEAGRFDILPEPFEIAPLIDSCCDIVRLKAQENRVDLLKAYSAGLPELVADKRACKQILINLLSNAVKFTKAGGRVTVGARAEGNSIILYVADTGIGIGDGDLGQVGSAFFQARSAYDRPYEGTGLGLSVVRGLVGLHAGAILLESAPGMGTCVTVRLPRDGRAAHSTSPAQPAVIEVVQRTPRHDLTTPILPMVKKIA